MLISCFGEVCEQMLAEVGSLTLQAGVNKEDITVIISTYGGELYPALGIYDLLRHHAKQGYKVTTIATGACMSAGMVMLQAGTTRAMTANAFLMTHYGEDGASSSEDVKQNNKLHELHKNLVSQHSNASKRVVNNWYKADTYFDANNALKFNLVDEVIDV